VQPAQSGISAEGMAAARWSKAMNEPHLILGIGELLWDILPEGLRAGGIPVADSRGMGFLGGAPANFTVMAGRLGNHAAILSRIGRDDLGRKAVDQLEPLSADTSFLEVDPAHETGRVTVTLNGGQPSYVIHQPSAWDFMELTDDWVRLAERADAICFGSLAQRSHESRQTIQTLAAQTSSACIRVFDVNLRPPFYSGEVVQESLELATVLKMNDTELPLLMGLLGLPAEEETAERLRPEVERLRPGAESLRLGAERMLEEFPTLDLVAVTRGAHGSLLVRRGEWHEHPGFPVKVADTIGAGDAFTAAMTHYLLRGAGLATLNEAGNRWGGWMAAQQGAMPALPEPVRSGIATAIDDSVS